MAMSIATDKENPGRRSPSPKATPGFWLSRNVSSDATSTGASSSVTVASVFAVQSMRAMIAATRTTIHVERAVIEGGAMRRVS